MELLQRLRDPFKVTPQDAAEAADEIERLKGASRAFAEQVTNDYKEIKRLREALKIFAIYADYLDENYGDHPDHYVSKAFKGEIITFGDFRKARSTLQQKDSE